MARLFCHDRGLNWLSETITQDRTPELRQYLMRELEVAEITPETILSKLSKEFLEEQSDDWIIRLYAFLTELPGLSYRFAFLPLIRLEDGTHVSDEIIGQQSAFLPSDTETGFPTVRRAICANEVALEFLKSLGLTKPDPVDDIVRNVLPKYREKKVNVIQGDYEADIRRIVAAFATDSKGQRELLIGALRESAFVRATDAGNGSKWWVRPDKLYIPSERLKELVTGVTELLLVDDGYTCLRGGKSQPTRSLRSVPLLKPIQVSPDFTWQQQRELREKAGHAETSGQTDRFVDWSLMGLESLLKHMGTLGCEEAARRAEVLWEALRDVHANRGQSYFTGTYRWSYHGKFYCEYPSSIVRALNDTAWVLALKAGFNALSL